MSSLLLGRGSVLNCAILFQNGLIKLQHLKRILWFTMNQQTRLLFDLDNLVKANGSSLSRNFLGF